MNILGIDYGKRKVGLATADSALATPLSTIKYQEPEDLLGKLDLVVQEQGISEIVVGVTEGEMEEEQMRFGKLLEEKFGLPVHFQDETLSTHDAQILAREAGIGQLKRRRKEDAYAATIILQGYLDSLHSL